MSNRPNVPRNVEKQLWSESMGHCMNPECMRELIEFGSNVGEMAHITANSESGDASFDNLILLCRICHKNVDDARKQISIGKLAVDKLREWKAERNREIRTRFQRRYESFAALKAAVTPILQGNGQIFDSYGPDSRNLANTELHPLWRKFEPTVIANNTKLEAILVANKKLLHFSNQEIVDRFVSHAREFVNTRGDTPIARVNLFPKELLSVFGLDVVHKEYVPNVSALQNLIAGLMNQGRFIALDLAPHAILRYRDDAGSETCLHLGDRPNLEQIYFNRYCYTPRTTNMRLESLIFVAGWLHRQRVPWNIPDYQDLTTFDVNNTHRVKFLYEYTVSVEELSSIEVTDNLLVVNLHNWNGGPYSEKAMRYARTHRFKALNRNGFFSFVHRLLGR